MYVCVNFFGRLRESRADFWDKASIFAFLDPAIRSSIPGIHVRLEK